MPTSPDDTDFLLPFEFALGDFDFAHIVLHGIDDQGFVWDANTLITSLGFIELIEVELPLPIIPLPPAVWIGSLGLVVVIVLRRRLF